MTYASVKTDGKQAFRAYYKRRIIVGKNGTEYRMPVVDDAEKKE